MSARDVAESAARACYGRLVAFLSSRSRDVAAAEDALGDAFAAALATWPRDGVPDRPEAWLLTAARRRLTDGSRRSRVRNDAAATLRVAAEEAEEAMNAEPNRFPDHRLRLMFICAHPAIDAAVRTPLMLQTVLGLDARRIAPAFLVKPATMAQRLARAKTKIRDAGIPFEAPEPAEFAPRVAAVIEAVYAAYGAGWDEGAGRQGSHDDLAAEAIDLARLTASLLPHEPEAKGLLALVLFCEARRPARRGQDGAFVPLSEQDVRRWSRPLLREAEAILKSASEMRRLGQFQIEAAIQAAHAERAWHRPVPWRAIAGLYHALVALGGGTGAAIGEAAAVAEVEGAAAGLALLDGLCPALVIAHQPYWACRAHLLAQAGDPASHRAYERAIALTSDPAVRAFLMARSG